VRLRNRRLDCGDNLAGGNASFGLVIVLLKEFVNH
jgi:hypothetical protein